jgi:thioredoxin-related protein
MKIFLSLTAFLMMSCNMIGQDNDFKSLDLGVSAPMSNHKMLDVSGTKVSLNQAKKENGLLVIFSCNTCPFVINWEDRYLELMKISASKNIGLVFINSNEAFRKKEDSFEAMQNHYKEKGYHDCYYLVDENHQVADAFGARTTPHVYLFNAEGKLVFKGAIDDNNKNASEVKQHYLKDAIENMIHGKEINPSETKNLGCSIKRLG